MLKNISVKKDLTLIITAVCLLCIVMSALAYGIGIGHDCAGESCSICFFISTRDDVFKALCIFAAVFFLPLTTLFLCGVHINNDSPAFSTETPVRLKVKLSD
jgi:hypothetical protein